MSEQYTNRNNTKLDKSIVYRYYKFWQRQSLFGISTFSEDIGFTIAKRYIGAYTDLHKKIRIKSGYPDLAWKISENPDLKKWTDIANPNRSRTHTTKYNDTRAVVHEFRHVQTAVYSYERN